MQDTAEKLEAVKLTENKSAPSAPQKKGKKETKDSSKGPLEVNC
jgi:hypothetical protein